MSPRLASLSLPMLGRPAGTRGCPFIFLRQTGAVPERTPSPCPWEKGAPLQVRLVTWGLSVTQGGIPPRDPQGLLPGHWPPRLAGFPLPVAGASELTGQTSRLSLSLSLWPPPALGTWEVQRGQVLTQGHIRRQGPEHSVPSPAFRGWGPEVWGVTALNLMPRN